MHRLFLLLPHDYKIPHLTTKIYSVKVGRRYFSNHILSEPLRGSYPWDDTLALDRSKTLNLAICKDIPDYEAFCRLVADSFKIVRNKRFWQYEEPVFTHPAYRWSSVSGYFNSQAALDAIIYNLRKEDVHLREKLKFLTS